MTEPKRWSSPQSEVDPVLRSVLLYGRNLSPDSQQLQAILRGAEPRRSTPQRRRLVAFVVAGAAVACAGVAWAGYASGVFDTARPAASAPVAHGTPPIEASRASAPRTPAAASSATDSALPDNGPVLPMAPSAPVGGATSARLEPAAPKLEPSVPKLAPASPLPPEQDAALLQQAQRLVAGDPARALTLTRDHELHFPASPLAEERQALRIEALARLGRHPEAARELASFDQRFPHSIYRHRLHALLPD